MVRQAGRHIGAPVAAWVDTRSSDACAPLSTLKVTCQFVADKGQGSHARRYFGDEFTTLKDRKKEIGRDLLAKMCADLKIDPHDL